MRSLVYINQVVLAAQALRAHELAAPLINEAPKKVLNDGSHLNATQWAPYCEQHIAKVLKSVDMAYTDVQLHEALTRECWMDKEFVHYADGFHKEDACEEFSQELVLLRHKELHQGDGDYHAWCLKFYEHKWPAPAKEAPPAPPAVKPMVSYWWVVFVLLAAGLTILATRAIMVKG